MALAKKNQEALKQSTLLKWVRPNPESEIENREEQAGLEEISQAAGIQAAGTSRSTNSNINTTRQGPDLPAPSLASALQAQINRRTLSFPKRFLETLRRNVRSSQCGSNNGHGYITTLKLTQCFVSLV